MRDCVHGDETSIAELRCEGVSALIKSADARGSSICRN